MDKRTQDYFDTILKKEPETLSEIEIKFLRARRSYLKKAQLEEYDNVLNPKVKEVKVKEKSEEENQTPVKGTVKNKNANTK